jgi:hypothetical protein
VSIKPTGIAIYRSHQNRNIHGSDNPHENLPPPRWSLWFVAHIVKTPNRYSAKRGFGLIRWGCLVGICPSACNQAGCLKTAGGRFGLIRGRVFGVGRRAFWNAPHMERRDPLHLNWATIFSLAG